MYAIRSYYEPRDEVRRSFSKSSLHRELLIIISSCGARHNETVVQELIALERPKSEPVIFDFTVGRQSVLAWMFDESPAVTAVITSYSIHYTKLYESATRSWTVSCSVWRPRDVILCPVFQGLSK